MKKMILAILFVLAPLSSQALFEVRAGYGNNTLDTDTWSARDIDNGTGFNIDAIFEPPIITDLGIGLRYESMTYEFDGFTSGEIEMERLALLLNYKVIDLFLYLGFIGTFDISNDISGDPSGLEPDAKFMWTAGVEGGVNLGLISVGAEVGKLFGTIERNAGGDQELDGLYGKVLVGFGF